MGGAVGDGKELRGGGRRDGLRVRKVNFKSRVLLRDQHKNKSLHVYSKDSLQQNIAPSLLPVSTNWHKVQWSTYTRTRTDRHLKSLS